MNASPEHQKLLLDVADLDRRITQAEIARTKPTQAARINELAAVRQGQVRELVELTGAREDVQAELTRLESDVAVVEQRRARDVERLAATANPKDAQAFEREIEALNKRQSDLEDAELEVMSRLEEADAAIASKQAEIDAIVAEGTELTAAAKASVAAATTEGEQLTRDRAAIVGSLPDDLVAEYTRRSARATGAGLLRRGTCEACMMVLAGNDLNVIRQAAPDAVVSCPECGAILVRTDESGL